MKIRNGFVSNSSSSSFVVNSATTAQVALLMLYQIKFERMENWGDTDDDFPDEYGSAIKWLSENREFNDKIAFPWSTNEETFVLDVGNKVLVVTCHNHSWRILGGSYNYVYSDECNSKLSSELFLNLKSMKEETRAQVRGY